MLRLAWKFLKFDKAKSIGVITAVVISIFLIGQQLSLLFFLMGLMGNLVGNAPIRDNELWIIEKQTNNVNALNYIDQRLVQEIASLPMITDVQPVVIGAGQATFLDGQTAPITLVGAQAPYFVLGPIPEKIKEGTIESLLQPYSVSAEFFSAKTWNTTLHLNKQIEINGKSAEITLITKNAQAFGASLMYTSIANARYYGNIPPNKVSIIVATLSSGIDKQSAIQQINTLFPNLKAWEPEVLRSSSIKEILISSNMGMSFGTLVVFAMISGFFIIGLTLYSSALDRIKDYGTLKAIGATNKYVNRLIIAQAFLYAVIGYFIAIILLIGFKYGVAKSGLIIDISIPFSVFLFLVTLVISVGGSLFAVRKISKLEPASVF